MPPDLAVARKILRSTELLDLIVPADSEAIAAVVDAISET